MKRRVQPSILAVVAVWIMLWSTGCADKSPSPNASRVTFYAGRITLRAIFHMSYQGGEQSYTWVSKGRLSIFVDLDGPENDLNEATIDFDDFTIIYDRTQAPNEYCSSIYEIAEARAKASPMEGQDFDLRGRSVTVPIGIGKAIPFLWRLGGNCPDLVSSSKKPYVYNTSTMDSLARRMKLVKLPLPAHFKAVLGGSCRLPGWDYAGGGYVYTEDCDWSAYMVFNNPRKVRAR